MENSINQQLEAVIGQLQGLATEAAHHLLMDSVSEDEVMRINRAVVAAEERLAAIDYLISGAYAPPKRATNDVASATKNVAG